MYIPPEGYIFEPLLHLEYDDIDNGASRLILLIAVYTAPEVMRLLDPDVTVVSTPLDAAAPREHTAG